MSKSSDKVSTTSGDGFSWQMFWHYFSSELCTDEMRTWTMKNTNIVACITGAMPQVQIEILEAAPQVLINHPAVVAKLTPEAKRVLLKEVTTEVRDTRWVMKEMLRKRGHYIE